MISERWQQEVAETVYEAVNSDTDKNEARKRAKNKQQGHEEGEVLTCTQTMIKKFLHRGSRKPFTLLSGDHKFKS